MLFAILSVFWLGVMYPAVGSAVKKDKPKVAVMPVVDASGQFSDKQLEAVANYIRAGLGSTGHYLVIDESRQRRKLEQFIDSHKKESYRATCDEDCQIPLGKKLAADTLLRTKISKLDRCMLTLELIDIAKEAQVAASKVSFACRMGAVRDALATALGKVTPEEKSVKNWPEPHGQFEKTDSVELSIATEPPELEIEVDGELVGTAPVTVEVTSGAHSVSVESKCYRKQKRDVTVTKDDQSLQVRMEPQTKTATLKIRGIDASKRPRFFDEDTVVYLDRQKRLGRAKDLLPKFRVPVCANNLVFRNNGDRLARLDLMELSSDHLNVERVESSQQSFDKAGSPGMSFSVGGGRTPAGPGAEIGAGIGVSVWASDDFRVEIGPSFTGFFGVGGRDSRDCGDSSDGSEKSCSGSSNQYFAAGNARLHWRPGTALALTGFAGPGFGWGEGAVEGVGYRTGLGAGIFGVDNHWSVELAFRDRIAAGSARLEYIGLQLRFGQLF